MRALVISGTHFGAWTGEDILRQQQNLTLLAPHLDVDEVVFLGDMFDLLFGSTRNALMAADGLFDLLRARLQGRRFVFLAGNHDHYLGRQRRCSSWNLRAVSRRKGCLRRMNATRSSGSSSDGSKELRWTSATPPTRSAASSAPTVTISTSTPAAAGPRRGSCWHGRCGRSP